MSGVGGGKIGFLQVTNLGVVMTNLGVKMSNSAYFAAKSDIFDVKNVLQFYAFLTH